MSDPFILLKGTWDSEGLSAGGNDTTWSFSEQGGGCSPVSLRSYSGARIMQKAEL